MEQVEQEQLRRELEELRTEKKKLEQKYETLKQWNNSLLQQQWPRTQKEGELSPANVAVDENNPTGRDVMELLQELRIHQEELRVQNEELREIRRSLELSQARYQDLFRYSPLPCLVLDEACRIRELNHQAALLLGQANPDLYPERMPISLFLHRYSQDNFRKHFQRVLSEHGPQRDEWKLRDEQIVVAHSFALPTQDESEMGGCQIVLENVTLQRQEELQKLQEREDRLLQAQQLARLGDWQWESGRVICSPHLYTLLQIHPSTASTAFFSAYLERIPEAERATVQQIWESALQRSQSFSLAHYFSLAPGQTVRLRVQGSPASRDHSQERFLGVMQVLPTDEQEGIPLRRSTLQLDQLLQAAFPESKVRVRSESTRVLGDARLLQSAFEELRQTLFHDKVVAFFQLEDALSETHHSVRLSFHTSASDLPLTVAESQLKSTASDVIPFWQHLLELHQARLIFLAGDTPGFYIDFPLAP
jgi:PAS domain-containing protein